MKTNSNVLELKRIPLWTSASSEGPQCDEQQKMAWCTTGTIVEGRAYINDTQLWEATPAGSVSAGNCVTLSLNQNETSVQLSLAAGTESNSYMCQVLKFRNEKLGYLIS
jgi:hypothetical protein